MTDRDDVTGGHPAGRLLARNTALNLAGSGLPLLVAVAAMPALARALDPARFGLLAVAWLVLGYGGELGFGRATTKYVAESLNVGDDARLARIAWNTLAVQAAFGVAAGALLAAAAPLLAGRVLRVPPALAGEAVAMFRVLGAAIPILVIGVALRGLLEAVQRFDLVNAVRAPAAAANFLLPLAGALLGWSLAGIALLLLAARAGALVAYYALALRCLPALRGRPRVGPALAVRGAPPPGVCAPGQNQDRAGPALAVRGAPPPGVCAPGQNQDRAGPELRRVAAFGGWTSVSGIVSPMLIYLDRFLLGALVSMAAVGYYTAPYEVAARLLIVPAALVGTLFPAFSTLHGLGEAGAVARLGARGVKYTLLAVGPLAVLLIAGAGELLRAWLGSDFAGASTLALQILAVGIAVNAAAHIPVSLLHGVGRPEVPARFHLLELPLHAVVAFVSIRLWGIPGAAAAWTLRVTVDAVLLFVAAARLSPLTFRALAAERVPRAAALLALGVAAAGAAAILLPAGWARPVAGVIVAALLAAVTWRQALGVAERASVARLAAPMGVG